MKLINLLTITATSLAGMVAPGVSIAVAAPAACVCPASFAPGAASIGTLQASTGTVSIAGTTGFGPLKTGSPLPPNGEIKTGPLSSAELLISTGCSIKVGANSTVSLTMTSQGLCARVTEPTEAEVTPKGLDPLGVGAAVLVGGTALAIGIGLKNQVSQ